MNEGQQKCPDCGTLREYDPTGEGPYHEDSCAFWQCPNCGRCDVADDDDDERIDDSMIPVPENIL